MHTHIQLRAQSRVGVEAWHLSERCGGPRWGRGGQTARQRCGRPRRPPVTRRARTHEASAAERFVCACALVHMRAPRVRLCMCACVLARAGGGCASRRRAGSSRPAAQLSPPQPSPPPAFPAAPPFAFPGGAAFANPSLPTRARRREPRRRSLPRPRRARRNGGVRGPPIARRGPNEDQSPWTNRQLAV